MFRTAIGLAAGAAIILTAGPAFATQPDPGYSGGGRGPGARLTLSYMADAGFAVAVKLDCDPPGGGHPRPAGACAELASVDGNPDRIEPAHNACFLIYSPVTADIAGDWHGTSIAWRHKYGNVCEMHRALGVLFAF